jgi:hypothetical protein
VASAGCSATLNCNNACSLNLTCSAPYQPWFMSCSASSQTVSCTGNTSCNVESNYVQCDGRKYFCTSNQCSQGSNYIRCGSTYRFCEDCEDYTVLCPIAP